ncbi:hypothetical protein Pryu01_02311 [Paraliobacillus ryukyuensis]|uniref:Uncharacterized protein n=1 Tax=Paraliobacillus ryukyuensis TaxID=200904 RepID=A0A366DWS8_9BACI|nr:hypothetical protein DES48_11012 [Paraliobacillus ryukyuensis]
MKKRANLKIRSLFHYGIYYMAYDSSDREESYVNIFNWSFS